MDRPTWKKVGNDMALVELSSGRIIARIEPVKAGGICRVISPLVRSYEFVDMNSATNCMEAVFRQILQDYNSSAAY